MGSYEKSRKRWAISKKGYKTKHFRTRKAAEAYLRGIIAREMGVRVEEVVLERRKHHKKPWGYMFVVGPPGYRYIRVAVNKNFRASGFYHKKSFPTLKLASLHAEEIVWDIYPHLKNKEDVMMAGDTRTEGKKKKVIHHQNVQENESSR